MAIDRFIFRNLSKALATQKLYLTKSLTYKANSRILDVNFDYVRFATLEACYEEITARKVAGNVAELGVYKGDFAKRLNQLFADRKLYLFDTFEGFARQDVHVEQAEGFSTGAQNFSDTSLELVMKKMAHPENCIVRKGFFPATAAGIVDSFCFVSLDADLFEPIYQGLLFFYPQLEKGGYIFVHDFNNDEYKGARQAVVRFCQENSVGYVPIPDSGGTVVITK